MGVQYIKADDGEVQYAIVPIKEYRKLLTEADKAHLPKPLLSEDHRYVSLPHGGPDARIDVLRLVEVWARMPFLDLIPIGKRHWRFEEFTGVRANCLDAIIRRCFLPKDSAYRNSMQPTIEVVDALIATGVFSLTLKHVKGYYRAVQCLRIKWDAAKQYLHTHGQVDDPVDIEQFILV